MRKILVIAPHADDETLGCGGALLKHRAQGDKIHWLMVTQMQEAAGFSKEEIKRRQTEIENVATDFGFSSVHTLGFAPAGLDALSNKNIIGAISGVVNEIKPEILYLPNPTDVHTDHQVVFKAGLSCTKSFRYPFIKKVRLYETLSETGFNLHPEIESFKPNLWIDISGHIEDKINIMKKYRGEIAKHPFPRSEKAIEALATLRGSQAGCEYAEAFISVKELL